MKYYSKSFQYLNDTGGRLHKSAITWINENPNYKIIAIVGGIEGCSVIFTDTDKESENIGFDLTNEFGHIRHWAWQKGILDNGDKKTQCLKLVEEVGELAKAIIESKKEDAEDAIGDIVVVLTSLAHLIDSTLEKCINQAFNEIKDRKGKMNNGTFIKDEK